MMKLKEILYEFLQINDKFRIHDSARGNKKLVGKINKKKLQAVDDKPDGFWYGFGTSWIEWTQSEKPEWSGGRLYLVEPRNVNLLKISNEKELLNFTIEYGENRYTNEKLKGTKYEEYFQSVESVKKARKIFKSGVLTPRDVYINWSEAAKNFDGIEINPMIYKLRLGALSWYYSWDVASGCIWNAKDTKLINIGYNLKLFKKYKNLLK